MVFAVPGKLEFFVDGFWTINREYSAGVIGINLTRHFWSVTSIAYGYSAYLVVGGLVAHVALLAGLLTRTVPRTPGGRVSALSVLIGSICGGIWTLLVFDGDSDTLPLLPGAAISLAAVVMLLRHWRPAAGIAAVTALSLFAVFMLGRVLTSEQTVPVSLQRKEVATVFDRLSDDATLLVAGAPEVSVLADKTNPTRFQRFSHGLWPYLDDVWPGGQEGYYEWIDQSGTTVLAVRPGSFRVGMRERGGLDNYVLLGPGRDWYWYINTDATTHAQRAAIRRKLIAQLPEEEE